MATLNARANTYLTSTGATWSTTANAVDGVFGATNNTYATFTSLVASAVGVIDVGFGTQLTNGIPSTATGISVSVTIRHLETVAATVPTIKFQPVDNATLIGTAGTGTSTTANHANSATFTPTLAQLRSSTFKIRVTATRAAVTTAGNFSLDNVDVAVTYTVPKVSTLTDQFTSSISAVTWPNTYGTTAWVSGQAALTERINNYSGLATAAGAYDMTESSLFCMITPPTVMAASTETMMAVYQNSSNGLWFVLSKDTGTGGITMILRSKVAGANNDTYDVYDAVQCAYVRIRMSGTTAYWDTSPNAIDWINRRTLTVAHDLTVATVEISIGQWQTESTTGTAYIDNVNYAPPRPLMNTLTDSFTTQISPALWTTWGGTTWEAGRVRLDSTSGYMGLVSAVAYDLRESYLHARITPPPYAASRETQFQVHTNAPSASAVGYIMFIDQVGRLALRQRNGSSYTFLADLTYDLVNHAWLRIRHSGSTIYFDGSSDGVSWVNLYSAANSLDLSIMMAEVICGQWGTEADVKPAYVDDVNVTPALSGRPKVWNGTAWVKKPEKVWTGVAWVEKPVKVWTGATWKVVT